MSQAARTPAEAGRTQASALGGWPAYLLTILVAGAGIYAFSPRAIPPFPPSEIKSDQLLVNGLANHGKRLIAVGELGHILIADSVNGPWREARIENRRGSTLTQVMTLDEQVSLAVGHDALILRSKDRGESWQEVHFDPERSEALLGVAGPFGGKLFAFGAFGLLLSSADQGLSWQRETINEVGKKEPPAEEAPPAEGEEAGMGDPFADFAAAPAGGIADRHFNAMARGADGALLLVGERGLIARSTDNGQSWKQLESNYTGSFYGVLPLGERRWLAFGMRGNVYRSSDDGDTWQKSRTPSPTSMFGGARTANGRIVLVGASNTTFVSDDDGLSFKQESLGGGRNDLAAVLPLTQGSRLVAGVGGIRLDQPSAGANDKN